MITRFAVSGYRNFAGEFVLDLLGARDYRFAADAVSGGVIKDALIYGKNAVGKSNLGRALFDIVSTATGVVEKDVAFLNADSKIDYAMFEYGFLLDGSTVKYVYSKFANQQLRTEELCIDEKVVFSFDHQNGVWNSNNLADYGAASLNYDYLVGKMSVLQYVCNNVPKQLLGVISVLYDYILAMRLVSVKSLAGSERGHIAELLDNLIAQGRIPELEGFLRRFGIEEALAVRTIVSGEKVVYFKKAVREVPFVENCSSGTASLVELFDALGNGDRLSLIFVDEFDAFYHHDLAEGIVRFARTIPAMQFIATTHNTDLFSNKVIRPDCLFILSKTGISSAANATNRELREGHNLEKLYKAGEFDAR